MDKRDWKELGREFTKDEIDALQAVASRLGVRVVGLHAHVGSGILDPEAWARTGASLAALADRFPDLEWLDMGGGLGVAERPGDHALDLDRVEENLATLRRSVDRLELRLEPGRYVVSEAGVLSADHVVEVALGETGLPRIDPPGVVDEQVDRAEPLGEVLDRGGHRLAVGDVGRDDLGRSARGPALLRRRLQRVGVPTEETHGQALLGEADGEVAADASTGAGHESDRALIHRAGPPRCVRLLRRRWPPGRPRARPR